MKINKSEIKAELSSIFLNKTFDALLPPLIYTIINSIFGLKAALILAVITAFFNFTKRVLQKDNWKYSLAGLAGVIIAALFAYLSNNAGNYFIPALISSAFLVLAALISILLNKPLAAWASYYSYSNNQLYLWNLETK